MAHTLSDSGVVCQKISRLNGNKKGALEQDANPEFMPNKVLADQFSHSLEGGANLHYVLDVFRFKQNELHPVAIAISILHIRSGTDRFAGIRRGKFNLNPISNLQFKAGSHAQSAFVQLIAAGVCDLRLHAVMHDDPYRDVELIAFPSPSVDLAFCRVLGNYAYDSVRHDLLGGFQLR
jgi:hypothetical protein